MTLKHAQGYLQFLEKHKAALFCLILAIVLSSVIALRHIVYDNSDEAFFTEGDPTVTTLNRFRELFGNEDFVSLAIPFDNVFLRENLLLLQSLAETLDREVPHLREVKWLGSAEYIRAHGSEVLVSPGLEEIPESQDEIYRFRDEILRLDDFVDVLVSKDCKIACIVLEIERYPKDAQDPRKDLAPSIKRVLALPQFAHLTTYLTGPPIQDYETDALTSRETARLTLFCLLLEIILLYRMGNGIRAVIAPVGVILVSILATMGLVSALGLPVSLMCIMLPTMLFSVCIGDTVHIIAEYQIRRAAGFGLNDALATTLAQIAKPCLFTSLTTMMGFCSFVTTDIVPIRMAGIYSALGVLLAFCFSLVLTPLVYFCGNEETRKTSTFHARCINWLHNTLSAITLWSLNHARAVLIFFVLTSVLGVLLFQTTHIETNLVRDIDPCEKLRRDSDFFDASMGGAMALELIVDSGRENGARDINFLRDMERLQRYAESLPGTTKTHSIVDIIKRVNEALHNEDHSYFALPPSQERASQYLFFYETSGGKNLDRELSLLSDTARIHIQTLTMGTAAVQDFIAKMNNFVAQELGGRLAVSYTGHMAIVAAMADYVRSGQMVSLLAALITITLMMFLCLRSLPMALLSMLPNIATICLPLGFMGLFSVPMSLVLMIFSSVIIGVAVDTTTHFYVSCKRFFSETGDYYASILKTIALVGQPATFTMLSLVLGFLLFTISHITTQVQFGLLGACAFFYGWLADITLSPALLVLFHPLGPDDPNVRRNHAPSPTLSLPKPDPCLKP
ncbi:MAG: MMPL family transporter [Desulfovibrionaceae bacterium]|nr:MMPL family transporter [Desulfovibrionaceae bacterium]